MDQVHVVRHKVLIEGQSQRAVARALGLSRVTVRRYLDLAAQARPPQRQACWLRVSPAHSTRETNSHP
jgi:response regulator of citrate/malate metabolism